MITREERDIIVLGRIVMYCNEISETIERFGNDIEIFRNDKIYVNAVAMPIMQIGELTNHLSEGFKE